MTAIVWVIGILCAFVIVSLLVDKLIGRYIVWRDKRDLTIRDHDMRKWNLTAFRGTKKSRTL